MSLQLSITPERVSELLQGRFEVGLELGRGGEGVVFRGRRLQLADGRTTNDEFALKIHLDPQQDERIALEIRMMQGVRHPCLANLLAQGMVTDRG